MEPVDLSTLNMDHRNIEIGGGDGGCNSLIAVGDAENHVGDKIIKYSRQLADPGAGGLGAGNKVFALHLHVNGGVLD